MGFPGGAEVKNLLANAGVAGDMSSVDELGISHGGGNGNPLQSSCQKTPRIEESGGLQSTGSQRVGHD